MQLEIGKLQWVLQRSLKNSHWSARRLCAAANIHASTLRRLLENKPCRELQTLERCLLATYPGLIVENNGKWKVLTVSAVHSSDTFLSTDNLETNEPINVLDAIRTVCQRNGVGPRGLASLANIPVSSAHRLLRSDRLRIADPLLRCLNVLNVNIGIIDEGCARPIRTSAITSRRRKDVTRSTTSHQIPPIRERGTLLISKSVIFDLRVRKGLSYGRIAEVAGVCSERVRQIVSLLSQHR